MSNLIKLSLPLTTRSLAWHGPINKLPISWPQLHGMDSSESFQSSRVNLAQQSSKKLATNFNVLLSSALGTIKTPKYTWVYLTAQSKFMTWEVGRLETLVDIQQASVLCILFLA